MKLNEQQFLQQLMSGLNQLEVKGNNVLLLGTLMNMTRQYINEVNVKQIKEEKRDNKVSTKK